MALRKFDIGTAIALAISIAGGIFWLGTLNAKIHAIDTDKLDNKIKDAITIIDKAEKSIMDQLPVGTIIASVLEPAVFLTDACKKKWHLADDSAIPIGSEYEKIVSNAKIKSKHRLPDLRGVFLRGLNVGRNDGREDRDGEKRLAGHYQPHSTALPTNLFTGITNVAGQHEHSYNKASDYNSGAGNHARAKPSGATGTTSVSGKHNHIVTVNGGGDKETRPRNVAVYFYIKIN